MQNINVNIVPDSYPQTIRYSQGDVGREFKINVVGFTIPTGATVKIQATKPSGFGFSVAGTVVGNAVSFTTTAIMTDEAGRFPAELEITKDSVVIGTANFIMWGEANPHPEGTTDGQQGTIIPELTLLVERVEAAASSVLDMEVVANTLPAGSQATYSYDEDLNKATFGIPQGEAGAGAAGVVASAYSASATYKVGDYVIHNSNLYRCTTAITTAEAFTAAHWTQIVLADDVSDLKTDLDEYADIFTADVSESVSNWLDEHPEATTTVEDHSLTYNKLVNGTLGFVTPQMYGAKGDGIADDTDAIKQAIATKEAVFFPKGLYNVAFEDSTTQKQILFALNSNKTIIFDEGAILNVVGNAFASLSAVFGVTSFPCDNVKICGGTIQTTELHSPNPMGVRLETPTDAEAEQITNISVQGMKFINLDSAVYIVQRRTSGVSTRQVKNVIISNCKGYSCLSSFVTADGENITISNCVADGENNASAYDAVSVHSGRNIKIVNNTFKGYTIGQVVNIRNSPENKCGSSDVLIKGNIIKDCPTTAIQISTQSGEAVYGCTRVSVENNLISNCTRALSVTPGSATSGTPFRLFTIANNIIEDCDTTANFSANTTVWAERITITGNSAFNSGSFTLFAVRATSVTGNYLNLKSNAEIKFEYLYYSVVSGNNFWLTDKEYTIATIVYTSINANFFGNRVVKLSTSATCDFLDNNCMGLITIDGVSGFDVKTALHKGKIIVYSGNYPTGASGYNYKVGDMYINNAPSGVYGWVCTTAGNPGTWKAIALA